MSVAPARPEDLFTLDIVAPQLTGFQPPQGPHDPAGDWQLAFGLYSLGAIQGVGGRVGRVTIGRQRLDEGLFELRVDYEKPAGGNFLCRAAGQIHARAERLSAPLRWKWRSEIVDPDGRPVSGSVLEASAVAEKGEVRISGRKRPLTLAGPWTLHWLLFEAVGRMPRQEFPPLEFTLLDDFDQPKPNHRLWFAQSTTVLLGQQTVQQKRVEELEKGRITKTVWAKAGGQAVPLHVYHQVGDAVVPWVWWVDDQGRLLVAVSGLEVYVLDAFAE